MAMCVFGYSEPTSGRFLPPNPRLGCREEEYYQSEAEGLLECHKCRYLCTGRGEPLCRQFDHLFSLMVLEGVELVKQNFKQNSILGSGHFCSHTCFRFSFSEKRKGSTP